MAKKKDDADDEAKGIDFLGEDGDIIGDSSEEKKKGKKKGKKGKKGKDDDDLDEGKGEDDDDDDFGADRLDTDLDDDDLADPKSRDYKKSKRKKKQNARKKKRLPFGLKVAKKSKGKVGTVDSLSDYLQEKIAEASAKQRKGAPIIIVGKRKGDKKQKPRILELKELKKKMRKEVEEDEQKNPTIVVVTGDRSVAPDQSLETWAKLVGFRTMSEERVVAFLKEGEDG